MSSHVRSIEDAALGIIGTLKHILEVNTICVTINDQTRPNRIVLSFNRLEPLLTNGNIMPLLTPSHQTQQQAVYLHTIPNLLEDFRTADSEAAKLCGPCALTCAMIYKPDTAVPIGSICLLDKSPFTLSEQQQEALLSMASLLGYIIELENASVTDSLTALYNRRYLTHLCNSGSDKQYSVLFIDIDDFKEVNDRFGHDAGDALLQEIASRLKSIVRKSDVLIRYGGDEFLICLQHLKDSQDMTFVADKIKLSLKQPYLIGGQLIYICASVGISMRHSGAATLQELITDADHSMYDMKHNEKNH